MEWITMAQVRAVADTYRTTVEHVLALVGRVDRGVTLLRYEDDIPWHDRIDLSRLDLSDGDRCILAQWALHPDRVHRVEYEPCLGAAFERGLRVLGIDGGQAYRGGFLGYGDLEDLWRVRILVERGYTQRCEGWPLSALPHADYPHEPGMLYDCPRCEAECHCTDEQGRMPCVFCALLREEFGDNE